MNTNRTDRRAKWIRRVARGLSIPIIGFTLIVIVGHLVAPEPAEADYPPIENLLPVIVVLSVTGLGVAWHWEGLGGAISLGFFLLHLILFWVIRQEFFPLGMLLVFSPLPITAALFLACWWLDKRADDPARPLT